MELHIFATEVAGLTGRNPYPDQSVEVVAEKIRRRFQGLDPIDSTPYQAATTLLRKLRPVEKDTTEEELPDLAPVVEQVAATLKEEIETLTKKLEELPVSDSSEKTEEIEAARATIEATRVQKTQILKEVPTAAVHVDRMDIGTVRENPTLREVHRRLNPDYWNTSQKYIKKHIGDVEVNKQTVKVFVGGRMDAVAGKGHDRYVIEVKNRKNGFKKSQTYESVQVQTYLAMMNAVVPPTGKKKETAPPTSPRVVGAYLCQGFNGETEISPPIKFNAKMWERIREELLRQARLICMPP